MAAMRTKVKFSCFLAGRSLARGADFRKNLSAGNQCKVMKQRIKRIFSNYELHELRELFFPRSGGRCRFVKGKNRCPP